MIFTSPVIEGGQATCVRRIKRAMQMSDSPRGVLPLRPRLIGTHTRKHSSDARTNTVNERVSRLDQSMCRSVDMAQLVLNKSLLATICLCSATCRAILQPCASTRLHHVPCPMLASGSR